MIYGTLYHIKAELRTGTGQDYCWMAVAGYDCPIAMAETVTLMLKSRIFDKLKLYGPLGESIVVSSMQAHCGGALGYNWGKVDPTGFLAKAVLKSFDSTGLKQTVDA